MIERARKSLHDIGSYRYLLWAKKRQRARHIEKAFDIARKREFGQEILRDWQALRLSELLKHCSNNVPAYRRVWGQLPLINYSNAHNVLSKLPKVTKDDLVSRLSSYVSTQSTPGSLRATNSSGASGRKSFVLRARATEIDNSVVLRRLYSAAGLGRRATVVYLTAGLEEATYSFSVDHGGIYYVRIGVERLLRNPGQLEALSPTGIFGPPHFLLFISQAWSPSTEARQVVSMFSSFEHLAPDIRFRVESNNLFKVRDVYAASEISTALAFECEEGIIHANADYSILEVVDEEDRPVNPGEEGHVLVTDICNFAMPLIRYRLGDVVTKSDDSPCTCGRVLPTIASIQGRSEVPLLLPNGAVVPPETVCQSLRAIIEKPFTLIQEDMNRFTLVVFGPALSQDTVRRLRQALGRSGFPRAQLTINFRVGHSDFVFVKHVWFLSRVSRSENRLDSSFLTPGSNCE